MALSQGIVVKVVTELAPKLPKIMGVESEIREALTNLIFNAVDAMPEGGTLTLRTRIAGGDVEGSAVVEVVDTGIGMDEQTQLRCLEPFFTTKGERGTGLGLAMVFGMVQRHSCAFEIDSARGEGTTMRLVFAVQTGALDATGHLPALKIPKRLRLLLVDDDPILLKSLRDTLETDGHVIVTASGGEEGIAAFRMSQEKGERFAAVFTDLGMPYVDGRQVAEAVKEVSPTTPVIMLTGWGRRLEAEGDIPPHVDKMLAKPPKLREVREALIVLCCERAPA
jgi:CheY-like chemotaxis protein/anti-sigma regulatory factor (Ser/Thr protein kinase)